MPVRLIVVLGLIFAGAAMSLKGPIWSLITYLWLAYFRPERWVFDPIVAQLGSSFYFGAFTVIGAIVWREKFFVNGRVLLMFAVVLHSFLSTMQSPHVDWSWRFWTDFIKIVAMGYMIPVVANDLRRFRWVIVTIVFSIALDGAKQGWVFLLTRPGAMNVNDHVVFGDNNAVGVGMMMVLPFVIALKNTSTSRWERIGYQVMAIGTVYRAVITYSRGTFLTCAAVGLFYLLRTQRRARALIGITVVLLLVIPALPPTYWDRIWTIGAPEEGELREQSSRGRLYFWSVAVEMARVHPILGVGHNAYNVAYDTYAIGESSEDDYGTARAVHSQWFGILADLGYPGLGMFIALFLLTIVGAERVRRRAARHAAYAVYGPYAVAVEVSIVAVAVGGSFLTFQYVELTWHLFAIGIALERLALAKPVDAEDRASAAAFAPMALPAIRPVSPRAAASTAVEPR